jgi:hypothetical protein
MAYVSPHRDPHDSFPQPDNAAVKVWRYLDLPRFIWMLSTGALAFTRVDSLEDPFEGSVPPNVYDAWKRNPENAELMANARSGLRRQFFVSCWHANDVESEAMWRLYCGSRDGIALQTTYERLDASLPKGVFLGQVTYVDYDTDTQPPRDALALLMRKRQAFEHEHEVRALIWPASNPPGLLPPNFDPETSVINVPWDADEFLDQIYVSPYADEWYRDAVAAVIEKFAPALGDRLTWSHMRGVPLY